MEFSVEFWVQLLVLTGGIAAIWGGQKQSILYIKQSIDKLEKKQDKHNNLIERMISVEASTKASHKRMDRLERKCDFVNQAREFYGEENNYET